MVKNGKVIVLTFFIFMTGILFITFKISYSLFTYKGSGTKVVNIKSNGITFKYTEGSNTFSLNDAMPMTDEQGMAQDNYFEFSINGTVPSELEVPYYITARKTSNSSNIDEAVRLYLTRVDKNGNEELVKLINYDNLPGYKNENINLLKYTEKIMYNGVMQEDTNSITYRLRLWINQDVDYTQERYNGAVFGITVNVYSKGKIKSTDEPMVSKLTYITLWQRPEIENISTTKVTIGSNVYTSVSNKIIGGDYWNGNRYENIDVPVGETVYITSSYGSETRWYLQNDESAYLCTGTTLVGTMPDFNTSIMAYPDVKGHNNSKRRVLSGLLNLRCE